MNKKTKLAIVPDTGVAPAIRKGVSKKAPEKAKSVAKGKAGAKLKLAVKAEPGRDRAGRTVALGRMEGLMEAIAAVAAGTRQSPRTTRLLRSGVPKLAQKVVEEAAEVAIEAVRGKKVLLVNESVDLLYNLAVLWHGAGIDLAEIWAEMDRRDALLGLPEKLPK